MIGLVSNLYLEIIYFIYSGEIEAALSSRLTKMSENRKASFDKSVERYVQQLFCWIDYSEEYIHFTHEENIKLKGSIVYENIPNKTIELL